MSELIVRSCGPGTTIQDAGRFGWQRYGVGPAGAMDRTAMAIANVLVGNGPGAAAIELALAGAAFEVAAGACRVALTGGAGELKIDGRLVPSLQSATAHNGQIVEVGAARSGMYQYLAVAGGLALPAVLGSLSLHMRAGIGGIDGRGLRAGDRLPLALAAPVGPDLTTATPMTPATGFVRVVLGPQDDYFSDEGLATFLGSGYTITPRVDRMGLRLSGPHIAHSEKGYNIVSDGIATGAIQVPGNGEPLILLADRQTTGGYPKIATVISADLGRLSQMRPGAVLRFAAVSREDAVAILRDAAAQLERFRAGMRPAAAVTLDSERLLGLRLVDGWVSAT